MPVIDNFDQPADAPETPDAPALPYALPFGTKQVVNQPTDVGWIHYAPATPAGVVPIYSKKGGQYKIWVPYGFKEPLKGYPDQLKPPWPVDPSTGIDDGVDDFVKDPRSLDTFWDVSEDLALARAGALHTLGFYRDFFQGVDVVDWDKSGVNSGTVMGTLAVVTTPAYLQTCGYLFSLFPREGIVTIGRVENEIATMVGQTHMDFDYTKKYRIISRGNQTNMLMDVYEGSNLLEPLATVRVTDHLDAVSISQLGWDIVRGGVMDAINKTGGKTINDAAEGQGQGRPIPVVPDPRTVYPGVAQPHEGQSGIIVLNFDRLRSAYATFDNYLSMGDPLQTWSGFPGVPQVADLKPAPHAFFYPATNGLSFQARTYFTNEIDPATIRLILNGTDVSGDLNVTKDTTLPTPSTDIIALALKLLGFPLNTAGADPNTLGDPANKIDDGYLVRYTKNLEANRVYEGTIIVGEKGGLRTTNTFAFDTFIQAGSVTVEAEDYNFDNGKYKDDPPASGKPGFFSLYTSNSVAPINPAPAGYYDRHGFQDVDYGDFNNEFPYGNTLHGTTLNALWRYYDEYRNMRTYNRTRWYRQQDFVGTTQEAADVSRKKNADLGIPEYSVWMIQTAEWMNYTRNFPNAKYNVYLRASAFSAATGFRLDRVLSNTDKPSPEQQTAFIGNIIVPNTRSQSRYRTVPMLDGLGRPQRVSLSGLSTVRLSAWAAYNNVQLNYLLFVPDPSAPAKLPPVVNFANPTANGVDFPVDGTIEIRILNQDTAVDANSIKVKLDGTDISDKLSPRYNFNWDGPGAMVYYRPAYPGYLTPDADHTIDLEYTDSDARLLKETWKFHTAKVPTIPASFKLSVQPSTNFTIKIHQARDDAGFPNSSDRAEKQLANQMIDPVTTQPFVNLASPADSKENGTINYNQDGSPIGYFGDDRPFPGISPGDPQNIAMSATINLYMEAGLHRWGVASDDGFIVSTGPLNDLRNTTLGIFEGGRGVSETQFNFIIPESGVYPFRLLYYEGQGGANVEWYLVNRRTGSRTLLNSKVPAANAHPLGTGVNRGFVVRVNKAPNDSSPDTYPNNSQRAEDQLRGYLNSENEAAGPAGDGVYYEPGTLNYEQAGNPQGFFNPSRTFPGIDPAKSDGDPNFIALEATAYLELQPGRYVFGVRSDDGFIVSTGPSIAEANRTILGFFEGGRGSSETEFEFNVPVAGLYPVRVLYYEGQGGADLEFYSINDTTNERILINDPANPNAIKAYQFVEGDLVKIKSIALNQHDVGISFPAELGNRYTVQYTDVLAPPNWIPLQDPIDGDGTIVTVHDSMDIPPNQLRPQRYYRVVRED